MLCKITDLGVGVFGAVPAALWPLGGRAGHLCAGQPRCIHVFRAGHLAVVNAAQNTPERLVALGLAPFAFFSLRPHAAGRKGRPEVSVFGQSGRGKAVLNKAPVFCHKPGAYVGAVHLAGGKAIFHPGLAAHQGRKAAGHHRHILTALSLQLR